MNITCTSRLSQFWTHLQHDLFPFLREEDHLVFSPALEKVIRVLEFTAIDRFIPSSRGLVGRPPQDRVTLCARISRLLGGTPRPRLDLVNPRSGWYPDIGVAPGRSPDMDIYTGLI